MKCGISLSLHSYFAVMLKVCKFLIQFIRIPPPPSFFFLLFVRHTFESHLSWPLISNIGKNHLHSLKREKKSNTLFASNVNYWNQFKLKKNKISFSPNAVSFPFTPNTWEFQFLNQNYHENLTHKGLGRDKNESRQSTGY